jgi:eukaryotic-like serine/threonine-protein kinase
MQRTTWDRINELFEAARALPAEQREAWVRGATADAHIQSEVLSLLHAHQDDPWFVDEPGSRRTPSRITPGRVTPAHGWPGKPTPAPGATPSDPGAPSGLPRPRRAPEAKAGGQFADYRLVREMASSPARATFEAVATGGGQHPRVSLHVFAADTHGAVFSALLHAEGNILAKLDHPGIPRLLDGGVTEDGTAYLAFEYAAGDPIDAWCRERKPAVRERVSLVLAASSAVQHAHEHLVAHGDLRPANVIVSADKGVKLLDCGMWAVLGFVPATGGTPPAMHAAMSPEQARGEVLTTASDVYALGVLLYTLLTGYPPYEIAGQTPDRARQMICEVEPDVPSTIVGARDRRALAGTLDRIILKALRKNPRERYATAAAFAADLRAWRDGHPASVAPATFWSSTVGAGGKRALRLGRAALIVGLLAGIGVLGWQFTLVRAERDQVRASLAEANLRLAGMQARAAGADPARRAAAAASLDAAAAAGERVLASDPAALTAAVALAGAYGDLVGMRLDEGDARAAGAAEAKLRALVGQLGREHRRDAQARAAAASGYVKLGAYREAAGDAAAAKAMYGDAIAAFEKLAAERALALEARADYARAQRRLGAIALREGALGDAERLLLAARAFDTGAGRGQPEDPAARLEMAETTNGLALAARRRGDLAKATALWTQALTEMQAASDADSSNRRALEGVADVQESLGSLYRSQRRFEESLARYREALRARERAGAMTGAPPSALVALASARTSVARLLLDLVEVRPPGPADAGRLREAGALLAQAGPAVHNAALASPEQQAALAELDRQAGRLRRLSSLRR